MEQNLQQQAESSILGALQSAASSVAPTGSVAFDAVVLLALAFQLAFAVVAMHYALKPWADKALLMSITGGALASLVLHLSMLHTPDFVGEGVLWKFASVSRYLPWAVLAFAVGSLILAAGFRVVRRLRAK